MGTKKTKPTAATTQAPQGLSRGEREAAKRARKLRRQTSGDEQKLWHQLRDKQLDGFRFKRQRQIGKYVVDFVSDEAKLIVELSEKLLESNPIEKARAAFFKSNGYRVVQMLNSEVAESIKTGLEIIRKNLKAIAPEAPELAEEKKPKKVAAKKTKIKVAIETKTETATETATETETVEKVAKKPAAKKAVVKKIAADMPAEKKPSEKKPAAKKPAAKKSAAKKPVTKKKVAESDQ